MLYSLDAPLQQVKSSCTYAYGMKGDVKKDDIGEGSIFCTSWVYPN